MERTRCGAVSVSVLCAVVMLVLLVSAGAPAAGAGAYHRPIADFLSQQGQLLDMNGDGTYTPNLYPAGDLFVPPVPNYMGWISLRDALAASVDYAGVAAAWLEASGGPSLGTTFSGNIVEHPLPDGTAEVDVVLLTRDALTWVVPVVDMTWDFANGPLVFGVRAQDVLAGAVPSLGDCQLHLKFINTAPGAPLPDLIALMNGMVEGASLEYVGFRSTAFGMLSDGSRGRCTVSQTAIVSSPAIPGRDWWPAERVMVQRVGRW